MSAPPLHSTAAVVSSCASQLVPSLVFPDFTQSILVSGSRVYAPVKPGGLLALGGPSIVSFNVTNLSDVRTVRGSSGFDFEASIQGER